MHNIAKNYSNSNKIIYTLYRIFCTLFRPYSHLFSKIKAKMAKIHRGGVHKKVLFVQLLIKYLHIKKKLYTFATLSFNIISNKGIYFVKIYETSASRLTCF